MLTKNKRLFRFDSCLTLQNSFFFHLILFSYFIDFVSFRYILFSYFTDFVVSFRWISFSYFTDFVSFRWISFSYFTDFVGFCFRFFSFLSLPVPASFIIIIVGILDLYELPPFTEVMNGHFKKNWMERYCKKVNQHLLEYKVTTGLPEYIILEPAQHYIARDGENSYCLGLDQQFSPGCKTGHHKGKNANRNIHATNTKEQVQPVRGGSNLPNMQTGNRNHNSRYYKLPII